MEKVVGLRPEASGFRLPTLAAFIFYLLIFIC
jgi:hypothetical protein